MGHLYNTEGITFSTPGLFANVQPDHYWSGTEYSPFPYDAWFFYFDLGLQDIDTKYRGYYAWAVRPGDVSAPVPEPGTLLLLGSGLVGLVGFRKKFKVKTT